MQVTCVQKKSFLSLTQTSMHAQTDKREWDEAE